MKLIERCNCAPTSGASSALLAPQFPLLNRSPAPPSSLPPPGGYMGHSGTKCDIFCRKPRYFCVNQPTAIETQVTRKNHIPTIEIDDNPLRTYYPGPNGGFKANFGSTYGRRTIGRRCGSEPQNSSRSPAHLSCYFLRPIYLQL